MNENPIPTEPGSLEEDRHSVQGLAILLVVGAASIVAAIWMAL
jgi:hypothetical protein